MTQQEVTWIVLKFGGTSVSSADHWDYIHSIASERLEEGYRVCLVHSALSGVSNALQSLVDRLPSGEVDTVRELGRVADAHRELAGEMGLDADAILSGLFEEMEQLVHGVSLVGEVSYRIQARIMATGELMATKLGSAYLRERGLDARWSDARDLLRTVPRENASEKARILSAVCGTEPDERVRNRMDGAGPLVVTQGFIASDRDGKTVLLGRGGSDVSASYLAAKLQAERLEIWTDVPGLFSANPRLIPSARLLKGLSYDEAQEIATNGAKVLHPRCITPVRVHGIPIHIRDTAQPELEGTVISSAHTGGEALVKAIAVRTDVILVSMESLGMWQQVGFLSDAFSVFRDYGLSIDLVSTSESNVTVSLDPGINMHFREIREDFIDDLEKRCTVRIIDSTAAISLLGRHIRTILHRLGPAFEVFQEQEIYLVSQAANDLNFTFVVDPEQADRLVRQLHEQVISQSESKSVFGSTWQQIAGKEREEVRGASTWWRDKREQLVELARETSPLYVYDAETIRETVDTLSGMEPLDRLFYAVKANANRQVLEIMHRAGLGFECVSIGEVKEVFELFPDIDPSRVLFTPNFAPREEYEEAFGLGVHVTLDNIFQLEAWPDLFGGRELFLRIDPGRGHGHHKHVRTGGKHSKFGIPGFELEEARRLVDRVGANVIGLHAHQGSGIKDPGSWKDMAVTLAGAAEYFDDVRILDVGGGLGIRENPMQSALDLEAVEGALDEFKSGYPGYELWIEPGRFLVAPAGVLLTRITQLKGKGDMRYVGVDTGMNSFIRPALYGSHHTIVNLSRLNQASDRAVTVVGPICESADKLGIDRMFPASEEGDVVLIANTGAYGRVMSSTYNMRMPAGEKVV